MFVLSKVEERCVQRPWRRGSIVKILGRNMGYKALETRMKQMWVQRGTIYIIDLRNDYYLERFHMKMTKLQRSLMVHGLSMIIT